MAPGLETLALIYDYASSICCLHTAAGFFMVLLSRVWSIVPCLWGQMAVPDASSWLTEGTGLLTSFSPVSLVLGVSAWSACDYSDATQNRVFT